MKKYATPHIEDNSFEFESNIAIPFDPDYGGSQQLGKERGTDSRDDSDWNATSTEKADGWARGMW